MAGGWRGGGFGLRARDSNRKVQKLHSCASSVTGARGHTNAIHRSHAVPMAPSLNKLTTQGVLRLKSPGYYGNGGGLVLQITENGSKSWLFRFRWRGRRREMGLGSLLAVDLAHARDAAQRCRQMLREGQDPLAARRDSTMRGDLERVRQMTFDQCAAAYIDAHRTGSKNPKHADQWVNTLATYASPLIGALPVVMVDTDLIVKVLHPIWKTKTETATRLRGRIERIMGGLRSADSGRPAIRRGGAVTSKICLPIRTRSPR